MKCKKVHLADLEMVYAITGMEMHGKLYCLAASEKRNGKCCLIDTDTLESHTVWDGPGGVMTLLPLEGEQAFLSIEEFYPVFDSRKASIWKTKLSVENGILRRDKKKLCSLPFVHRIGMLKGTDGQYLVGASLCSDKEFVEDWSKPGGIYVGKYEQKEPLNLENIYMGLTKNHGMFLQKNEDGTEKMMIGASEGILELKHVGKWETNLLSVGETSDIWMEDFDGDGEPEIAVIQGFHGEHIKVLKQQPEKVSVIGELPVYFGHVLWAGEILGQLCLIGGSRGEDKALTLYQVIKGEKPEFRETVLDMGTGATQISVHALGEKVMVLASNHGVNSVDMYILTKDAGGIK